MHTFVQTLCHIPLRRLGCFFSRHYRSTVCWCGAVPSAIHSRLSDILSEMSSHRDQVINSDNFPFGDYLWPLYLPLYWIFVLPVILLGTSLFDIAATSTLKPDATHVPTFYAPDTDTSGDTEGMLFFIALPIVATAFGALHLLAWNFQFPSHIEQLLWRIASLTITGIPAVPLAVEIAVGALYIAIGVPLVIFIIAGLLIVEFLDKYDFRLPDWSIELPDIVWDILGGLFLAIEILAWGIWKVIAEPVLTVVSVIIVGILAIVLPTALVGYMAARLVLLSQAVILLREQPASAFYAINWTRFLPHI